MSGNKAGTDRSDSDIRSFLYSVQVCKPGLSVKRQTVRAFLRFYGAFDRTRRVRCDAVRL